MCCLPPWQLLVLLFGKVQDNCRQSSFLLCRCAVCAWHVTLEEGLTHLLPCLLIFQWPLCIYTNILAGAREEQQAAKHSWNCFSLHFLSVPAPLCRPGHWWSSCQACLAQFPHPGPCQPVPEHSSRQPDEPAAAPGHPGEDQSAHAARGAAHKGGQ